MFWNFSLWDGDKNVYCYLKSTHGAQEKFIIQTSILNETPIFSPSNFLHYTIASQNGALSFLYKNAGSLNTSETEEI